MKCEYKASPNYEYKCILEKGHTGNHTYNIGNKQAQVPTCCPDGYIARYEKTGN